MAVIEISCNLSSSLFSFATELWGRSIIVPQYDESYNKTIFSTADPGFEKGVPQVYYMHNCMPTVQGYQSIGYDVAINYIAPPAVVFDNVFQLQTPFKNNFLFVPSAGSNYIYSKVTGAWTSTSPFPFGTVDANTAVTTAFIHGQTYIYYARYGCFTYDEEASVLVPVTLAGLDPTQILGITSANGYMIAISQDAVAWSSLVDPTDFTPSLTTGAGGGSVNDAKGPLIAPYQITGGFIIYCQYNAVSATYTGNSSFPFIFLEVAGSGGIKTGEQISYHSNMPYHIALNSYGIQEINKTSAKAVYSEASDFFSSKIFEDFDENSLTISSEYTAEQVVTKVRIIQARYLVLSYGINIGQIPPRFSHTLVYDLTLKRWGKLRVAHVDCFEWNDPNSFIFAPPGHIAFQTASIVLPKKSIAFLQTNGTVVICNFDYSETTANGVFLLGKFQFQRRHRIEHQYSNIETVLLGNNFSYYIIPTYDGKTLQPAVPGFLNTRFSSGKTRLYQRIVSGVNVSSLFLGKFNLTTMTFGFTVGGNR